MKQKPIQKTKTKNLNYLQDSGFHYYRNQLYCEGVSVAELAETYGTPLYIYSQSGIQNRISRFSQTLQNAKFNSQILFAVKANSNLSLLSVMAKHGLGFDIVSAGELFKCIAAGADPKKIVFSGVGKTRKEIQEALSVGIWYFNVESEEELLEIQSVARQMNQVAQVSFRINPDIDAKTHPYISTGMKKHKFGISLNAWRKIKIQATALSHIHIVGLSCHIGSQICVSKPFQKAWKELKNEAEKSKLRLNVLNLGGGLGIPYQNTESGIEIEQYCRLISQIFEDSPYTISIEPGRSIIAPPGILLTKLVYQKQADRKLFYIVDAAMNDLIRPALYHAKHSILFQKKMNTKTARKVDVVGQICESADTFLSDVRLPKLNSGDLFAFTNAGAYGMSMASQYNSRPRAAEVLVYQTSHQLIRRRENYDDLIRNEILL